MVTTDGIWNGGYNGWNVGVVVTTAKTRRGRCEV